MEAAEFVDVKPGSFDRYNKVDEIANIYNGRRWYISMRCLGPFIVGVFVDTDLVLPCYLLTIVIRKL